MERVSSADQSSSREDSGFMAAAQLDNWINKKFEINRSVAFIQQLYGNNFDPLQKFLAALLSQMLAPISKVEHKFKFKFSLFHICVWSFTKILHQIQWKLQIRVEFYCENYDQ